MIKRTIMLVVLFLAMVIPSTGAADALEAENVGQAHLHSPTEPVAKGYDGKVFVSAYLNPRTPIKVVITRDKGGYKWKTTSETVDTGVGYWRWDVTPMNKPGKYTLKFVDKSGAYGPWTFPITVKKGA